VRFALKVVTQNYRDFIEVILLHILWNTDQLMLTKPPTETFTFMYFTEKMSATYFDRPFSVVISECKGKVKLLQCLNLHHTMKVQSGVEVQRYPFFTSAELHAAAALPPGKSTDNHCIWCCMGPRAGLDLKQQGQIRCLIWEWCSDYSVITCIALWV